VLNSAWAVVLKRSFTGGTTPITLSLLIAIAVSFANDFPYKFSELIFGIYPA
jgi:hypothetical protein